MPVMRTKAFYNLAAGDQDHEVAHSATASPTVGALELPEQDHFTSFSEDHPFDAISFCLSEGPTQLVPTEEEAWPAFSVVSSPVSSDSSPFTPAEDIFCPPSPYSGLPKPHEPLQASISYPSTHELHNLAAEGVMQSPDSYYPNSPTDSFAEPGIPPLPQPLTSPPLAPYQIESNNMEVTSAPRPAVAGPPKHANGDRPYAQLLRDCFMSRPDHSMSLKDIYKWFQENTTKSSSGGTGWQNSIRHNLSMNAAFIKQDANSVPLTGGTRKGSLRNRSTIWTMEKWAVEDRVQSTTRYRKTNSSRKPVAHKNVRYPNRAHAFGLPNYVLAGNEFSPSNGMDRAAAGRRGGVATRHARERQRVELQRQQHVNHMQSSDLSQMGQSGWNVPRACTSNMISGFGLSDHFRMGGNSPDVPGYVGMQGGVHIGHPQMYTQQLPLPSHSHTLGLNSGHESTSTAHVSPNQDHHGISLGYVPNADMRCGAGVGSPQQDHQQASGHQQHNSAFTYAHPGGPGDYAGVNVVHSAHQPPSMAGPNTSSFGTTDKGLKNWGTVHSGAGGA